MPCSPLKSRWPHLLLDSGPAAFCIENVDWMGGGSVRGEWSTLLLGPNDSPYCLRLPPTPTDKSYISSLPAITHPMEGHTDWAPSHYNNNSPATHRLCHNLWPVCYCWRNTQCDCVMILVVCRVLGPLYHHLSSSCQICAEHFADNLCDPANNKVRLSGMF